MTELRDGITSLQTLHGIHVPYLAGLFQHVPIFGPLGAQTCQLGIPQFVILHLMSSLPIMGATLLQRVVGRLTNLMQCDTKIGVSHSFAQCLHNHATSNRGI